MIGSEYPHLTINIFIHDNDERGTDIPPIYKRFGVHGKKTDELNLLLVGDLKEWQEKNVVKDSHLFLLLIDVDKFFSQVFNKKGRNGMGTICRNCAL